jgi:alpha-galactosidase
VLRRRFLKVSGLSAAAYLFPYADSATGKIYNAIRYPDTVSVRFAGAWHSLQGTTENWNYESVQVSFRLSGDIMSVFVTAPQRELEFIKCSWKQATPPSSKYLADHWERSYGDLSWESPSANRRSPWYMLISDGNQTLAFGVKTGANSICSWQATPESLELLLDTNSGGTGVLLGERTLQAADIITTENQPGENPYHTDIRFCKMMCDKPKLPEKPVYGINDWYFAYGNNSRGLILEHTRMMAELVTNWDNPPFSVIDMGWSVKPAKKAGDCCWGDDFTRGNENFGDMSSMAEQIKQHGMRPGIWTRPLLANANDNPSYLIPIRPGQKDLKERFLDPTIPENAQRISTTIRLHITWGYQLIKHDYTSFDLFGRWGFEMNDALTSPGWHFRDRSITNAEIILFLYHTIRAAALDIYLIGCNTFGHLAAGIFELNRIGDDTSGNEWERTLKMGVNTLAFRLPQHNNFYAADGDCVGLTTKIPWDKNKQWLRLLAESSAPLFISAQPEAMEEEQKKYVKKSFSVASTDQQLGEPIDWMTNPRPQEWQLNGKRVFFDWGTLSPATTQ